MKHLSIGLLIALLLSVTLVSCKKGDKGDPGPAGPVGPTGAAGTAGKSGTEGTSTTVPYKSGSITGTVSGMTGITNEAFTTNLNYQYFKNATDNSFTKQDGGLQFDYSIKRYDSTGTSFMQFVFAVNFTTDNNNVVTPQILAGNSTITISSISQTTKIDSLLYFGTYGNNSQNAFDPQPVFVGGDNVSTITLTNLVVDQNSGAISFNYSIGFASNNNSTGNVAKIIGRLNSTPYNVAYRKGSSN
jgi:hypothetical protein